MIKIKVKVRIPFLDRIGRIKQAIDEGTRTLTTQAMHEWQDEAGRRLKTTRRRYQDAIQMTVDGNTSELRLQAKDAKTQWLVTSLEYGVEPFDMKPKRLEGKPAFFWSEYHGTLPGVKKAPGQPYYQPTPFVDIPFGGHAKEGSRPTHYRRMHEGSTGFRHPGFKPYNMRGAVIEYIKKTAPEVLGPLIRAKVSA